MGRGQTQTKRRGREGKERIWEWLMGFKGMGMGVPRKVLITGVSQGLGRALALELAKRGHTVIGCARSQEKITSLQSELSSHDPSNHLLLTVDVGLGFGPLLNGGLNSMEYATLCYFMRCGKRKRASFFIFFKRSDSSVEELARLVTETKGAPDIIVNNAGSINKNNKIWEVPAEEFNAVIDTNVKGTANILRHFLPPMIENKRGIIVNLSSGWGRSAAAEVAPYCAAKWAVEGLTRSVAKELPVGMAIVALSPGVVNTDMLQSCFGASASLYQTPEAWM